MTEREMGQGQLNKRGRLDVKQVWDSEKWNPVQMRLYNLMVEHGLLSNRKLAELYEATFGESISHMTVHRYVRGMQTQMMKSPLDQIQERVLADYEVLFQEAIEAWYKSQEDDVTFVEEREETLKGFREKVTERRRAQTGDPRHLANAHKALEAFRKIMGTDAPDKLEHIIKQEMTDLMGYLESTLSPDAMGAVIKALAAYKGDIE